MWPEHWRAVQLFCLLPWRTVGGMRIVYTGIDWSLLELYERRLPPDPAAPPVDDAAVFAQLHALQNAAIGLLNAHD